MCSVSASSSISWLCVACMNKLRGARTAMNKTSSHISVSSFWPVIVMVLIIAFLASWILPLGTAVRSVSNDPIMCAACMHLARNMVEVHAVYLPWHAPCRCHSWSYYVKLRLHEQTAPLSILLKAWQSFQLGEPKIHCSTWYHKMWTETVSPGLPKYVHPNLIIKTAVISINTHASGVKLSLLQYTVFLSHVSLTGSTRVVLIRSCQKQSHRAIHFKDSPKIACSQTYTCMLTTIVNPLKHQFFNTTTSPVNLLMHSFFPCTVKVVFPISLRLRWTYRCIVVAPGSEHLSFQ